MEIINGLNHYIGMATLHADNFIEFTVLPYIISFYALLILITALLGKKWLLNTTFIAFFLFGVLAMVDFWRWEYNYGHNLDPNAAIIVPGMAYQPPLIGFKQLLNFGAFSIPDLGGWMFIAGGLLLLAAVVLEGKFLQKRKKGNTTNAAVLFILLNFSFILLPSCNNSEPAPIKIHQDNCEFCKMTIADGRFGAELITKKGRAYKFDDLHCMLRYQEENAGTEVSSFFINDYNADNVLIDATSAYYVTHESVKSPMGGNTAAFKTNEAAQKYAKPTNAAVLSWQELIQK
ncbi:MAG: nitrous oxide reductase accessory protein NosL [Saprospiraceae bacterium]|nr:nitrous oxide reductase accessory protein NosL [Saprospiraceae bacterium]